MKTLLAVTVGGSCVPIVKAISDYRPDFVIFIVSSGKQGSRSMVDGDLNPCRNQNQDPLPNIVEQTRLSSSQYDFVELDDPDSLEACYRKILENLDQRYSNSPEWRKIADYTGGTKTMTASLVIAALQLGWELSVVRGDRTDLVKVREGTELASLVNAWEVRAYQQLNQAEELFNQFGYSSAAHIAETLMRIAPLSAELKQRIQRFVSLARGFDAWDRFDHNRAQNILEPYCSEIVPHWKFLKKLAHPSNELGYEPVFDLLLNAERRAERGRYDDAVARLYRCLEMIAQISLLRRKPSINPSNLSLDSLPEHLRGEYSQKKAKIKLSLVEDYDLLISLEDPVGIAIKPDRGKMLDILSRRNSSILAHGILPVGEETYREMHEFTRHLIEKVKMVIKIEEEGLQFPRIRDGRLEVRT